MTLPRVLRTGLVILLATCLACPPSRALVSLNDGRDRIFVTGTFSVGHDSNVFANSENEGDLVTSSSVTAEYARRAGWIGVNGSVAVSGSTFGRHRDQDFTNPSYNLEFTKQSGRTTGSLSLSGARESRADAAVNMRSSSWNYGTVLNVKYPAGINTFTGQFGYASRNYLDDTVFADLATYTTALDVIHLLPGERELVAGYRNRYSETSRSTAATDHSLLLGINGKLMRGVVGSIRAGWQTRVPHGGALGRDSYSSWTVSGTSVYTFSKRLNVSLQLSKDFSTTATDASVDVINASADAQFAVNSKIALLLGAGWGNTRFLGEAGRISPDPLFPALDVQREDTYANWSAGLNFGFNQHFKAGVSYSWFENWSTSTFADFVRTSWVLNLSTRW